MSTITANTTLLSFRAKLRGSIIHKIYKWFRYSLSEVLYQKIYLSLKLRRYQKLYNYISCNIRSLKMELPKTVAIDIVSVCNLRCPLCSVPPEITAKINPDKNYIPVDRFKKIISNLGDIVTDVSLVYAGEPMLHPQFVELLQETSKKYFTHCITNATRLHRHGKLIYDNLDYLQISFDGFSKESYEKYRIGGNYSQVKDNITLFLQEKKKMKASLPHTAITYIVHAYNEDEINDCRNYFLKHGADSFRLKYINLNVHRREDGAVAEDLAHWLPKDRTQSLYQEGTNTIKFKERTQSCKVLETPIIRIDGEVLLCCHDIFNTVKIGNIYEKSFEDIWFDRKNIKIRGMGKKRQLKPCETCGL